MIDHFKELTRLYEATQKDNKQLESYRERSYAAICKMLKNIDNYSQGIENGWRSLEFFEEMHDNHQMFAKELNLLRVSLANVSILDNNGLQINNLNPISI